MRCLHVLLHAALYFGTLSALTTLAALVPRTISARLFVGLPYGLLALGATTVASILLVHQRSFDLSLMVLVLAGAAAIRLVMRRWSWLGAQLFASATLGSLAYLAYAAAITYTVGRNPVYLVASSLLLVLELAALSLSLSYLFEIIDTVSRRPEPAHRADPNHLPKVA